MSGFIDAIGKIKAGSAAKKQAYYEAEQMKDKAGFKRALSHREAQEDLDEAQLLESRALAVAAASGGGVSDPTVINVLADIEEQGLKNALNVMATAETESRFLERSARAREEEGRAAKTAGLIGGVGSVAKMAEKYG